MGVAELADSEEGDPAAPVVESTRGSVGPAGQVTTAATPPAVSASPSASTTPTPAVSPKPPASKPPAAPKTTRPPEPPPEDEPDDVYYANCAEARAAGAAPLYAGESGYRSALDRDKDGVACES